MTITTTTTRARRAVPNFGFLIGKAVLFLRTVEKKTLTEEGASILNYQYITKTPSVLSAAG